LQKKEKEMIEIARNIKLLIVDVDGVLTDGSIILDNERNELKSFHVRDGHGIKMLIREGVDVAIITGRYSRVVNRRAEELGIKEVYQKCYKKILAYEEIKEKFSFKDEDIAYMGDDIVDIPLLMRAGLPVAVSDAVDEVKRYSLMITRNRGGRGAVREVCDFILKSKGLWERIMDGYTQI